MMSIAGGCESAAKKATLTINGQVGSMHAMAQVVLSSQTAAAITALE
jgi:hypothetical protein